MHFPLSLSLSPCCRHTYGLTQSEPAILAPGAEQVVSTGQPAHEWSDVPVFPTTTSRPALANCLWGSSRRLVYSSPSPSAANRLDDDFYCWCHFRSSRHLLKEKPYSRKYRKSSVLSDLSLGPQLLCPTAIIVDPPTSPATPTYLGSHRLDQVGMDEPQ